MYTAQITVNTTTPLEKIFEPEEKEIGQRARYTVHKNKDQYTFQIEAKDATALRAALSSITKILSVHEKTLPIAQR